MKKLLIVPLLFVLAGSACAADLVITYTIPQAKAARVKAAMQGLYPIPQIPDPEWVDPGDGSEAPLVDEFTAAQWAKERPRRWVRDQVARWEQKVGKAAILFSPDDTIIE